MHVDSISRVYLAGPCVSSIFRFRPCQQAVPCLLDLQSMMLQGCLQAQQNTCLAGLYGLRIYMVPTSPSTQQPLSAFTIYGQLCLCKKCVIVMFCCFIVALPGNVIWHCNVAAGPVQEEVFENERFQPFKGWGHNWPGHFLPTDKIGHWSHRDGTPGKAASMAFSTVAPKLTKVRFECCFCSKQAA